MAFASSSSDAPLGEVSVQDDLFVFNGTSYFSLDNVILTTARNAGIRAINTTAINVTNAIVQNLGSMAANASKGSGFSIASSVVR